MIVMGEDSQQQEADRRECQQYARGYHQRFGQEVDVHFFVDHDGLNGFARLFGHLTTYTSADGRFDCLGMHSSKVERLPFIGMPIVQVSQNVSVPS